MKYIHVFNMIIIAVGLFVAFFAALRVIGLLFAALMPIIDGVLWWLGDHALVIGLAVVIGFILWIFGDVCDAQARKERGQCD